MKTPISSTFFFTAGLCFSMALPLAAQGPGPGRGPGGRGGGSGGGPGMGGFQDAIHQLFENHAKIKRTVEVTDTGYKSRTVSEDPEVAKTLQKHVREMRERLGAGMMIRRWDPAFAELVEHYQDLEHDFKEVPGGVEMIARGKTPEAVKVAQNHARIVSGFVEKGPAQMHESHPRALGSEKPAAPAPGATPAACPEGKEKPRAGCPDCPPAAGKSDGPAKPAPAAKADCPKCRQAPAGEAPAAGKDAPQPH